jgi:hypothetical protein
VPGSHRLAHEYYKTRRWLARATSINFSSSFQIYTWIYLLNFHIFIIKRVFFFFFFSLCVCVCLVWVSFIFFFFFFGSFSLAQHPPILLDIDSSQPAASLYKRMGPSSCKEVEEEISTVLDTRRRRDERKSSSRPPTTHPPPNIYISSSHLLIHKRLLRGWVGGGRCVGGSSPPPPILLQFSHPFKYQSALRARCVYRWEHA